MPPLIPSLKTYNKKPQKQIFARQASEAKLRKSGKNLPNRLAHFW